jgi:hypothetical protein
MNMLMKLGGAMLQVEAEAPSGDGNSYRLRLHITTEGGQALEDVTIGGPPQNAEFLSFTLVGAVEVQEFFEAMAVLSKHY